MALSRNGELDQTPARSPVAWDDEMVRFAYKKGTRRLWVIFAIGFVSAVVLVGAVLLVIAIPQLVRAKIRKRALQRAPFVQCQARWRLTGSEGDVLLETADGSIAMLCVSTWPWRRKAFAVGRFEQVRIVGNIQRKVVIFAGEPGQLLTLSRPLSPLRKRLGETSVVQALGEREGTLEPPDPVKRVRASRTELVVCSAVVNPVLSLLLGTGLMSVKNYLVALAVFVLVCVVTLTQAWWRARVLTRANGSKS